MIAQYDLDCRVWVAAGNGPLRPIVCESGTREDAVKAYSEEYQAQQVEERVMARRYEQEQRDSYFSELAQGGRGYGEDLG